MKPGIPQTHKDSELGGLNDVSTDAEQWTPDRSIGSVSSDQYPAVSAACNTKVLATIIHHEKESQTASNIKKTTEEHIRNDSRMPVELIKLNDFRSSPFLGSIEDACEHSQNLILLWTPQFEDDDFYMKLSLTAKAHASRRNLDVIVICHGFNDTREPDKQNKLAISDTSLVYYDSTDFLDTMKSRLLGANRWRSRFPQIQQSKGREIMNKPTPPSSVGQQQPGAGLVQSATVPKHRADKDETSDNDLPCDVLSDAASQSGPALHSNAASSLSVSASSQEMPSSQKQPQMQVSCFAEASKTNLTEKSACTSANSSNKEENEDRKYRNVSSAVGHDDVSSENKPVTCKPEAQMQTHAGDAEGKIDKTNPSVLPSHADDPEEMDLSNESPETGIAELPPNTKSGGHEYKCMEQEPRSQDARAVMDRNETSHLTQAGAQDIIPPTSTSVEVGQRQPNTTIGQPDAAPNHGKDRDQRADTDLTPDVLSDAASQTSPASSVSVSSLSARSQDMLFLQKQPLKNNECFVEASKNNATEKPLFATVHSSNEEDTKDRKYRNESYLVNNDEVNCKSKLTTYKPAAQMHRHAGDADAKINETDPAAFPSHADDPEETDLSIGRPETGIAELLPSTEDGRYEYKSMGKELRSQDNRAEMMQNEAFHLAQTGTQDKTPPTSTSVSTSLDHPDTILKHRQDTDQIADTGPLDHGLSHIVSQARSDLHSNPESCSSLSASSQDRPVLQKQPQAQAKNVEESKTNPTEKPASASAQNSNKEDKKDGKDRNESNEVDNDEVNCKNKSITYKPAAQMHRHAGDADAKINETDPAAFPSHADDPEETDLSIGRPETGIAELLPSTEDGRYEYKSMGKELRSQDNRAEMMQNEAFHLAQTGTQDKTPPTSTSVSTSLDHPDTILKHRQDTDQIADTGPLDHGLSHIVSQARSDLHSNPESCSSLSASSQDRPVLQKQPQAQAKNFVGESKTNPTEKPACAFAWSSNEENKDRKYRNKSNWVKNDDVGAKNKSVTGKPVAQKSQMQTHAEGDAEGKMEETNSSSPSSFADDPKETDLSNESPDTGTAELPPNTKDGGHEYESMGGEASNVETPDNSTISDSTPAGSEGHTMKAAKESSNSDSTCFVDTVCESQYNHRDGYGLKTNTMKHLQSHDAHVTADESNMKSSKEFSQNKHFCCKRDPAHQSTDSEYENSGQEPKLSSLTIHTSKQDKRNRNKRGIEDVPEELPGEAGDILHAESEETLLKSPVDIQTLETDGAGVNHGMEGEIKCESLSKHTIDASIDGIFSSPCGDETDVLNGDSTKIMFTGDEYNNTSSCTINRSGMMSKVTSENYQMASPDCLPKRHEENHQARNNIDEMLSTGFQVQMNSMLDGTTHEIHPDSPTSAGEGSLKPLRGPLSSEVAHRISYTDSMYKEPIQESCPPQSLPYAPESAAGNSTTGTKTHPSLYQSISVDKHSTVMSQPSSPTGQAYQSAVVFNIARSDYLEISINKNRMQGSGASDLGTLPRKSGGESTSSATRNGATGDKFGNESELQTDSENTRSRGHSFTSRWRGLFCCGHKKYKKPKKPGKRRKIKE